MKDPYEMSHVELHEYYEARKQLEKEEAENLVVESLLCIALVILVSVFCAFVLGFVYQLAGPFVADVLTTVWEWAR